MSIIAKTTLVITAPTAKDNPFYGNTISRKTITDEYIMDKFDEELGKKIALTRAQAEAFNTASEVYFEFVRIVENYMYGIANLAYNSKATEYNCKSHVIDLYRQHK